MYLSAICTNVMLDLRSSSNEMVATRQKAAQNCVQASDLYRKTKNEEITHVALQCGWHL